ncbi:hypothetical protein B0H14DRAFT_2558869 [Mycena olivaceomarginata]|nr:hypothetical protein B0H14DRAFT_2558869 [Mycena olivaceomarginata]
MAGLDEFWIQLITSTGHFPNPGDQFPCAQADFITGPQIQPPGLRSTVYGRLFGFITYTNLKLQRLKKEDQTVGWFWFENDLAWMDATYNPLNFYQVRGPPEYYHCVVRHPYGSLMEVDILRLIWGVDSTQNLGSGYLNSSNCPLREALERQGYRQNHGSRNMNLGSSCLLGVARFRARLCIRKPLSNSMFTCTPGSSWDWDWDTSLGRWRWMWDGVLVITSHESFELRAAGSSGSDGDGDWTRDAGGVGAVEAGPPLACVADVRGLGAVRARRVGTTWMEARRVLARGRDAELDDAHCRWATCTHLHRCTNPSVSTNHGTIKANAMNWDPVKRNELKEDENEEIKYQEGMKTRRKLEGTGNVYDRVDERKLQRSEEWQRAKV